TLPPPGMPGNNVLNAVSGTSSSNVWAVGYQTKRYQSYPTVPLAEHWNGTKWTVARTPPVSGSGELHGVVAIAVNNVWAVGELSSTNGPLVEHFDGASWQIFPTPK